MLNAGDATLTFLGDTSQLDQVFARIPTEADASMTAAAASVGKLGTALDAVNFELDATASNVPYAGEAFKGAMAGALPAVKTLGQSLVDAGKGGTSLADAFMLIEPPAKQTDATLQNMAFSLKNVTVAFTETTEAASASAEQFKVVEEMTGVRLPRGINRFLSDLPGLGTAMTAAFSAGVVFFLVDAIAQVAEKLSGFIADTFIFTEAMKAANAADARLNASLYQTSEAMKKVNQELSIYGETAAQKTAQALEISTKLFSANSAEISSNQLKTQALAEEQKSFGARVNEMSGGIANLMLHWISWGSAVDKNTGLLVDNRKAIKDLSDANLLLTKQNEELAREMTLLNLQLRDEEDAARKDSIQKQAAFNQAKISAEEVVGKAMLALQKAEAEAEILNTDESGVKKIAIESAQAELEYQFALTGVAKKKALAAQSERELYQLDLDNLNNRLAVEKTLGAVGIAAAAATQVQIQELTKGHYLKLATENAAFDAQTEELEKNHSAKLINTYVAMMTTVKAIIKQGVETISSDATWSPLEQKAIKTATDVQKAFEKLGVTSVAQLRAALDVAAQAYITLSKSGMASAHDLQKAWLSVLQTQLEFDKAMGNTAGVRADQKAIDDLTKSLQKFEGETTKTEGFWDSFSADFKKKAHDDGTAAQQMGKMVGDSLKQMQQGFESAIAAALLSESSFVAGLEKSTAAVLAQLAAQAAVKALYFTAMGIAELATGFSDSSAAEWFAAAAEMGLVAGGAGAAAFALGKAGGTGTTGSSSGSSSSSTASTPTASSVAAGPGPSSPNVPRLFSGAIVTQPTMAMIGDRQDGGSQAEGVFPLGDPRAKQALMDAFGLGGGGVTHNYNIQGMISTSDLTRLTRVISRGANTGRVRMSVTNSNRVTRRT